MDSMWDYNCPQYVDFAELQPHGSVLDLNDGADEWFDIHHDDVKSPTKLYNVHFNKENNAMITPRKNLRAAKRVSLDKPKMKPGRVSIGEKKMLRRSVPARVLRKKEESATISEITNKMKKTLLTLPKSGMRNFNPSSTTMKVEKTEDKSKIEKESKDFVESLRATCTTKAPNMTNDQRLLVTKPKPFNLTESKREKVPASAFRSMAEQVAAFQKQTPARFRTQRRPSSNVKPPPAKVVQLKATIPITPQLQTRIRSRPTTAMTREQEETLALEEIRKQPFKHKPVDPKLFSKKPVIKKVEVKITKPKPFNLSVANSKFLRRSLSLETFKTEFRAKPVPAGLFEGPKGLGSFKEIPLTNPKSPAFASKNRTERRRSSSADGNFAKSQPKIVPPKTSSSGIPNIKWEKKATLVEPFSFDDKDKERFSRKDIKIKEIVEQEKKLAEFHAHPMPDLSVVKIPEKQVRPATEILPFKFIRENSGIPRSEKWKQEVEKMEEELEKQREAAKFKARPNKVIYEPPFIPEKSNKKLTNVSNFELHTELRSMEREDYEDFLKVKEARIEAIRKELELKQQEEERLALLEMRKNAEVKANPVRRYKPVSVKQSTTALTLPMTPNFSSKKK